MRNVFALLLVVLLLPALVIDPAIAGCKNKDCKCKGCKKKDKEITEFIYDATIPWPFRKKTADLDSDGDGVPDSIDKCPNTPRGMAVDEYGCPVSKKEYELLNTGMIRTSKILFEFEKADIKPESHAVLDEIGEILVGWPQLEIEIGGHTDAIGEVDYNKDLSDKRAKAVLDYLVKKFSEIERQQFTTKGYGESTPIASNDTEKGRAQNRRVEFIVLNKEVLKKEIEKRK